MEPNSIFFAESISKDIQCSKWDLINKAIKNKDVRIAASLLAELVDKEEGDFESLVQASVDLFFLGLTLMKMD